MGVLTSRRTWAILQDLLDADGYLMSRNRAISGALGIVLTDLAEVDQEPGRDGMIARIWRGWTRPEDTEAYAAYIRATGIVEYETTPGNQGAYLISRPDGDRTEFVTVSFWDTYESIGVFAGEDITQAVFYPEDDRYLVDRETTVQHYDVH